MKKIKVLESELKKNGEVKKQNEEMKESMDMLMKELENLRETGKENMVGIEQLIVDRVRMYGIAGKCCDEEARIGD